MNRIEFVFKNSDKEIFIFSHANIRLRNEKERRRIQTKLNNIKLIKMIDYPDLWLRTYLATILKVDEHVIFFMTTTCELNK